MSHPTFFLIELWVCQPTWGQKLFLKWIFVFCTASYETAKNFLSLRCWCAECWKQAHSLRIRCWYCKFLQIMDELNLYISWASYQHFHSLHQSYVMTVFKQINQIGCNVSVCFYSPLARFSHLLIRTVFVFIFFANVWCNFMSSGCNSILSTHQP